MRSFEDFHSWGDDPSYRAGDLVTIKYGFANIVVTYFFLDHNGSKSNVIISCDDDADRRISYDAHRFDDHVSWFKALYDDDSLLMFTRSD